MSAGRRAGRGELVEDGLQSADPRRRWVAVVCDRAFQISYEGELFFVGKAWRRASAPSPGAVCPLRAFGEPLGFAGCKACGHKVEPATSLRAAEGGTGADPARMARRYPRSSHTVLRENLSSSRRSWLIRTM